MKRLYIGLGISAVLIIGGIGYREIVRPEVNMMELGNAFYGSNDHYFIAAENNIEYKLISINDKSLKLQVDFKEFSGVQDGISIMNGGQGDKSGLNKDERKAVEKFFDTWHKGIKPIKKGDEPIYTKDEAITYKWIDKPFNMSLTKVEQKKVNLKRGGESYYSEYDVLEENGDIVMKKNGLFTNGLNINGINGSGVLELEFKIAY